MRFYKPLFLFTLTLVLLSCGNGKDLSKNFFISVDRKDNTVKNNETLTISILSKKNQPVDSVTYYFEDKLIGSFKGDANVQTDVDEQKLGTKTLKAVVYSDGNSVDIIQDITVVASKAPELYSYEIMEIYPHNPKSYTQGLEFKDDFLYESVGQYGESALLRTDLKTGQILERIELDKKYFAEGLTIIKDRIIQLTWKAGLGIIYDLNSFEKTGNFSYGKSKEGWGLCNNGSVLYKSDGTEKIWILDAETLAEKDFIQVVDNKKLRSKYNELEWVEGKIYANTYQNDGISIIDPESGAIEAVVDLRPLKKEVQVGLDPANEVLNGIAYHPESGKLYVTGKHWNKVFEIRIIKK